MVKLFKDMTQGMDEPLELEPKGIFRKGKIRVIIIYEDQSGKVYFRGSPKSYEIVIKGKSYLYVPLAILKLEYPTIIYFYNNPLPVWCKFEYSKVSSLDFYEPELVNQIPANKRVILKNILMDSESVNLGFNARFLQGLYARKGISIKALIILVIVIFVVIIIILQLTGKIDIFHMFGGTEVKK
jgi:hypothetical protein